MLGHQRRQALIPASAAASCLCQEQLPLLGALPGLSHALGPCSPRVWVQQLLPVPGEPGLPCM